ncbi:MAG: TlpA family protein disulfide reductase [Bdellovibrionales bacterium]|nr:TlpA family protein disulfide reductase [Bdellovibrionales bacterium]
MGKLLSGKTLVGGGAVAAVAGALVFGRLGNSVGQASQDKDHPTLADASFGSTPEETAIAPSLEPHRTNRETFDPVVIPMRTDEALRGCRDFLRVTTLPVEQLNGSDVMTYVDEDSGEFIVAVEELDRRKGIDYLLVVRTAAGREVTFVPSASDSASYIFGSLESGGISDEDPGVAFSLRKSLPNDAVRQQVALSAVKEGRELGISLIPHAPHGARLEWSLSESEEYGVDILRGGDGVVLRSAELLGKPYLIDVGASWCHPCRMLHDKIKEIAQEFPGRFGVVTINIDDRVLSDASRAFVEHQLEDASSVANWSVVRIPGDSRAWTLQSEALTGKVGSGVPIIVLVDENGNVVANDLNLNTVGSALRSQLTESSSVVPSGTDVDGQVVNRIQPHERARFSVPANLDRTKAVYFSLILYDPSEPAPTDIPRVLDGGRVFQYALPFDGDFVKEVKGLTPDEEDLELHPVNRGDGELLYKCDHPEQLVTVVLYSNGKN